MTTVSQIYFTNYFLNGNFINYSLDMMKYVYNGSDGTDPMEKTFPTRTQCVQHPWGTGWGLSTAHLSCILPANIWNQKLYLFLSYWWILLAVLGAAQLLYRLLTLLFRPFRNSVERWDGRGGFWTEYSDWIFYNFVIKNCNPILRKGIRKSIKETIKGEEEKIAEASAMKSS